MSNDRLNDYKTDLMYEANRDFWSGLLATAALVGCFVFVAMTGASESRPVPPNITGVPPVYLEGLGTPTRAPEKPSLAQEALRLHTWDRLSNLRVKDGDTLAADIEVGRGIVWCGRDIRIAGFDAWEAHRYRRTVEITDEELAKGRKATEAVEALLMGPDVQFVCLGDGTTAEYGREEGPVYAIMQDGSIVDVAKRMIASGHDRSLDENGKPR